MFFDQNNYDMFSSIFVNNQTQPKQYCMFKTVPLKTTHTCLTIKSMLFQTLE